MADQGKIRVVIVDDIAETRDNIEKLLYFEKDVEVVGKASTGREAIALAKQLLPDIILMDINMPDMDGIAATEAIAGLVPSAQVIMMSVQGESDYLRRAMLAGAREFLTKPVSGDELINSIRHVYKLAAARPKTVVQGPGDGGSGSGGSNRKGQVIAVFSPKGGVGVTALACNVAVALKLMQKTKKVALVDGNLIFGDVGVVLNLVSNKTINDLVSRIGELDADLLNDVLATHTTQVKVLLPPPNPQEGELVNGDHLRTIIEALRREYDIVVVDAQSSFQDQTMAVLDAADRILLVMTLEMTTIKNIKQFLEVAELLEYPPEKIMLVLNKADSKLQLRVDQIEANLKQKVAVQIGNFPLEMTLAINRGVPVVIDKTVNQLSKDIAALASLLVNNNPAVVAAAPAKDKEEDESGGSSSTPQQKGLLSRLMPKR